ncbi:MAG: hypothetical protein J4G04_05665 [Nitrosopumilaceae archaeon]|nr:hypothetical protein [Nitrosopumilaceae archaeon]
MAQQTKFITFSGKGECRVCGAKYTARGMAPHMKKHMAKAFGDPDRFIIRIDQGPQGPFWMYVQVSTEATFGVLDRFLRAVWMECCGHLSEFTVGGKSAGKRKRLSAVLSGGAGFAYQYDMGDTTALRLTVMGRSARLIDLGGLVRNDAYFPPPMVVGEGKVRIVALHEKVRYNCEKCGKAASYVCPQCIYDGTGACCEVCAPSHGCGDDMLLAAAQSPRVGTCGFEGGSLG